jgi:hypothetical protein
MGSLHPTTTPGGVGQAHIGAAMCAVKGSFCMDVPLQDARIWQPAK